jgi:membrane-associated phospholipid phosphatase
MLKTWSPRLSRFVAARLSPEGEMGLHLTVGVVLMVLAAWVFGSVAEDVVNGESITVLDVKLAHWLHVRATPGFTRLMLAVSAWHGPIGSTAMTLLLAWCLYRRGAHYWLLALVATVPGGILLNVLLKYSFHRARPTFVDPLVTLATYSFPSGHTAGATLLYGLLASFLVTQVRSWVARAVIVLAACLLVALVGLSRMYLGVHYLSDVLAAIAEGCTWLAICITAVSTLRRRRLARAQPLRRNS